MKSKSKESKLNKENTKSKKSDFQNLKKKISIDELNKENELQYGPLDDDLNDNKKKFQSIEDDDITLDSEKHKYSLKAEPNIQFKSVTEFIHLFFEEFNQKQIAKKLKRNKSRISLFIEPSLKDLEKAKKLDADCVEIHTGKLCNLINKKKVYIISL